MAVQELPHPRRAPTPPPERSLVRRAWDLQRRLEARTKNLGRGRYGRVFKMARKPDQEQFNQVAKVTAAGIALIGAIGFLIYFIMGPILHLS